MMFLTLFFLLCIQGFVSSEDNSDKFNECNKHLEGDRGSTEDAIPDPENILERCPATKEYVNCRIQYFSPEFDPMYNIGDYLMNKEFLDKICDKDSDLHKAYVENMHCFRSTLNEWSECETAASVVLKDYEKSSYALKDSDLLGLDEDLAENIESYRSFEERCLNHAHSLTCIGRKILTACDSEAFNTFVELFEGTRFGNHFCGKDDNPSLKAFVDYLESEEQLAESVVIRTLFEVDED